MTKKKIGASAPKFLVISDAPYLTKYTGTRDQLISLAGALPEHFPEGRKRVTNIYRSSSASNGLRIKKIKGGGFEMTKWHPYKAPVQRSLPLAHFGIVDNQGEYEWRIFTAPDFRPDHELEREIDDAALGIIEMVSKARDRLKRKRSAYLTLVAAK